MHSSPYVGSFDPISTEALDMTDGSSARPKEWNVTSSDCVASSTTVSAEASSTTRLRHGDSAASCRRNQGDFGVARCNVMPARPSRSDVGMSHVTRHTRSGSNTELRPQKRCRACSSSASSRNVMPPHGSGRTPQISCEAPFACVGFVSCIRLLGVILARRRGHVGAGLPR